MRVEMSASETNDVADHRHEPSPEPATTTESGPHEVSALASKLDKLHVLFEKLDRLVNKFLSLHRITQILLVILGLSMPTAAISSYAGYNPVVYLKKLMASSVEEPQKDETEDVNEKDAMKEKQVKNIILNPALEAEPHTILMCRSREDTLGETEHYSYLDLVIRCPECSDNEFSKFREYILLYSNSHRLCDGDTESLFMAPNGIKLFLKDLPRGMVDLSEPAAAWNKLVSRELVGMIKIHHNDVHQPGLRKMAANIVELATVRN